jgi:hypothetical protein
MSNNAVIFKEKFISFVEILGWKDSINRAEDETDVDKALADSAGATKNLVDQNLKINFQKYGHTVCPDSKSIQQDLDIKVTQISNCVAISTEISPAGIITLISNCHSAVKNLIFSKGLMCRGYITKGMIFHSGDNLIGTGYQKTHKMEQNGINAFKLEANEMGTPFVEIDPAVCDYIKKNTDNCVNIKFERLVETNGEITAIFPFKSMDHDFLIGDYCGHKFDAGSERKSNNAVRSEINKSLNFLEKNTNHKKSDAVRKAEHYRRVLKDQLIACNDTDIFLNQLDNL